MKKDRRFPKIITEEEFNQIIDYIRHAHWYQNNFTGQFHKWRDITACALMFYCGLRPGECLNLKWDDIDFEKRVISINPLSNKERNNIPAILTKPAIKFLLHYEKATSMIGIHLGYLFPSMWTWKPMTTDAMARRLQRVFRECGLSKFECYTSSGMPKYTKRPYNFRSGFATKVYDKTEDIFAVSKVLRQTRVESAQPYIHLAQERKIEMLDKVFE